MAAQTPDLPTIKAGNSIVAVWQRMRFHRSVEHLPSICYLNVGERVQFQRGIARAVHPGDTFDRRRSCTDRLLRCCGTAPTSQAIKFQLCFGAKRPIWSIAVWTLMLWWRPAAAGLFTSGTIGSAANLITSPYGIGVSSGRAAQHRVPDLGAAWCEPAALWCGRDDPRARWPSSGRSQILRQTVTLRAVLGALPGARGRWRQAAYEGAANSGLNVERSLS